MKEVIWRKNGEIRLTIITSAEAPADDNGELRHVRTRHCPDHFCTWGKYVYQFGCNGHISNSKHAIFSYTIFLGFGTDHIAYEA